MVVRTRPARSTGGPSAGDSAVPGKTVARLASATPKAPYRGGVSDVEKRLRALEDAVADLQSPSARRPASESDPLWLVNELDERHPEGAVVFGGNPTLNGATLQWQWGRTTTSLTEQDWDDAAPAFAALGSPVRLLLLRAILTGTTATHDLADVEGLGTTGQLHHHLRALVAAGWLVTTGRGRYEVPATRVVPLLVLLSATLSAP